MLFALMDCNNFYVSCERAFNPTLEKKPVIVLSNNDGCIISRSSEAKQLSIPMGAPFYQWKAFCVKHQVQVFSSNYELYGDMSQRVMSLLTEFNHNTEIYSIDEAFLLLSTKTSFDELSKLRHTIKMCTGIPISIGVGSTKTLAKIANQMAKTLASGVFFHADQDDYLTRFSVDKIWGVGRRLAAKLNQLNIDTAQQLKDADPEIIRLHFNVTLEKTVRELKGTPCLTLESTQPRKQIISSRSFGKPVTALSDLEEAVSHYMSIAAKKLRSQQSAAQAVYVFLQTNVFKDRLPQYGNGATYPLSAPTSDTRDLISAAKACLRKIYRKTYQYNKAGVMLLDIAPAKTQQYDLLSPVLDDKSSRVMQTIDTINHHLGKNTLFIAAEGITRSWLIKSDKRSLRYTTRWGELPIVFC
jgi:DNA polymerase V